MEKPENMGQVLSAAALMRFRRSKEYRDLDRAHRETLAICSGKMEEEARRFFLQYLAAMEEPCRTAAAALYLQGLRDCVVLLGELGILTQGQGQETALPKEGRR